jgi:hypothetical protein
VATLGENPDAVFALDLPTGLEPTSGTVFEPCLRATVTVTLALPKLRLLSYAARRVSGHLCLADIGVPPKLYREFGLEGVRFSPGVRWFD